MKQISKKGYFAIKQPEFKKIEATVRGGIALISQRIDLIKSELVMDYEIDGLVLKANRDKILLRGDAGLQPWAKQIMSIDGEDFVLCPENIIVGYEVLE